MKNKKEKGQLAVASVVQIVGVVLFTVVGTMVMQPMMSAGDRAASAKCKTFFDLKMGVVDSAMTGLETGVNAMGGYGQMAAVYGVGQMANHELGNFWAVGDFDSVEAVAQRGAALEVESQLQQTQLAIFNSLPDICGTIQSSCTGSVADVSKCLHKRISWTYYSMGGGLDLPYERKQDMFEVEIKVTEPSDLIVFAGKKGCEDFLGDLYFAYGTSFDEEWSIVEDMPGGTWCKITANAVNYETMAAVALQNCYDQPGGPSDPNCKCFYHPELGYSLSQGFSLRYTRLSGIEYPLYTNYRSCGLRQPEKTPFWFSRGWTEWVPNCDWRRLSALPGYENETCTLRIGMNVIGMTPMKVKTEFKTDVGWWTVKSSASYEITQDYVPQQGDTKVLIR